MFSMSNYYHKDQILQLHIECHKIWLVKEIESSVVNWLIYWNDIVLLEIEYDSLKSLGFIGSNWN